MRRPARSTHSSRVSVPGLDHQVTRPVSDAENQPHSRTWPKVATDEAIGTGSPVATSFLVSNGCATSVSPWTNRRYPGGTSWQRVDPGRILCLSEGESSELT